MAGCVCKKNCMWHDLPAKIPTRLGSKNSGICHGITSAQKLLNLSKCILTHVNIHFISQVRARVWAHFWSSMKLCFASTERDFIGNKQTQIDQMQDRGLPITIDPSNGLCNGTHLILTRFKLHVFECRIISGVGCGNTVLIPRISLEPSVMLWL